MLKKRLITALWGIPLVIAAVWFDGPISWFTLLAVAAGVLAGMEFYRITGVMKNPPLAVFGLAAILYILVSAHYTDYQSFILVTAAVCSLALLLFVRRRENVFMDWALMLGGVLYIGFLLYLLVILRLDAGRDWLFLALFATFGSDTLAYFVGKAIGRHKMAPAISPGTTWEGAIAGLMGAVIVVLLFTLDASIHLHLACWQAVILGLFISVSGQIGDLVESLLKRSFGVKDSGSIMPGHGGILDRLDSVLFAGAAVYLYYFLVVV